MTSIIQEGGDAAFEDEIFRHPFSVSSWERYISFIVSNNGGMDSVFQIYERALTYMPNSYKLWNNYLRIRRSCALQNCVNHPIYAETNEAHDKALVFMHKMPRIWVEYCKFLMCQRLLKKTRNTFDAALRSLPITQHHRIWNLYIKFANSIKVVRTTEHIYRRYLKVFSDNIEDYVNFLVSVKKYDEASQQLLKIINNNQFRSKYNKTKFQLVHQLCFMITQHANQIHDLQIPTIVRSSLNRFSDEAGELWCMLADYYIRIGLLENARDIFEQAVNHVMTVKDFGKVFDAYIQFEETIISDLISKTEKVLNTDEKLELEIRMERLEYLIDRRALLLSAVLLRQNPHNVDEWLNRANLYENLGLLADVVDTFDEAVESIDYKFATGKLPSLWIHYANFYYNSGNIADARKVYERGVAGGFRYVEDLVFVWCSYVEMEIKEGNHQIALDLLKRVTTPLSKKFITEKNSLIHNKVHRSLKLWALYADLSDSFDTFQATKAVYKRWINMKNVNPRVILNYANFLEQHNYFTEAFKVYEHGVAVFRWPNVFEIWNTYLIKFVERFGGLKLEMVRDLFEQALSNCPEKYAKIFYISYAHVEERFGLTKTVMSIYERAIKKVTEKEKYDVFLIYLNRSFELVGLTATRPIFENAIETLQPTDAVKLGLSFTKMELKLGEIDRCRLVFKYICQMAEPKNNSEVWNSWNEFEINYGNQETLRELLRIRRSVSASYYTNIKMAVGHDIKKNADPMQSVEKLEASAIESVMKSDKFVVNDPINFVKSSKSTTNNEENPEEISLDDSNITIEKKSVPNEVFGGLAR